MSGRVWELRHEIHRSFAETGAPPAVADEPALRELEARHLVVLDESGDVPVVRMAHPFANHRDGVRVEAAGRSWWGNCAWDALGIVALLGLDEATVEGGGVRLSVSGGTPEDDALFHVAVPARRWWDDVGYT